MYNRENYSASDPTQVQRVNNYLDYAAAHGMKVILDCESILVATQATGNWTGFNNYINTFKNHTALKGWYLADEPTAEPSTTVRLRVMMSGRMN